jgi:hypothetical protein
MVHRLPLGSRMHYRPCRKPAGLCEPDPEPFVEQQTGGDDGASYKHTHETAVDREQIDDGQPHVPENREDAEKGLKRSSEASGRLCPAPSL